MPHQTRAWPAVVRSAPPKCARSLRAYSVAYTQRIVIVPRNIDHLSFICAAYTLAIHTQIEPNERTRPHDWRIFAFEAGRFHEVRNATNI
jgi:hypothetical protein